MGFVSFKSNYILQNIGGVLREILMAKTTLHKLKERLAAKAKPENLDFGYCIPDCGSCCPPGLCLDIFSLVSVSEKLKVGLGSIVSEVKESVHCPFLNSYSVCIIHDMKERNPKCASFGPTHCKPYQLVEELEHSGCSIKSELKEKWLENLKKDYDKEEWVDAAVGHIIKRANTLLASYKIKNI